MIDTVTIKNLKKVYGKNTILDIVELTVKKGEFFTIIGPNGAGKSTLLLITGLLESFNHGEISIFGHMIDSKTEVSLRRKISFIFQSPLMYRMTVFDNIALGLKFRHRDRKIIKDKVNSWMEKLGISHLSSRPGTKLSGGEAARVSIARALVTEPELLLMDEPFSDLDPLTREKLIYEFKDLISGTTTIFVTHVRDEALILGDKLAFMEKGRILQHGTPYEVFNHPVNEQVADFVGVETILEGYADEVKDNLVTVKLPGGEFIKATGNIKKGEKVKIFIRPEHVIIAHEEIDFKSSLRNCYRGKIINLIAAGFYYRVELDCNFPLISYVTKQSVEEMNLTEEKIVKACFKATSVHIIKI
jgi:tungstate transport system ATP-binding protein